MEKLEVNRFIDQSAFLVEFTISVLSCKAKSLQA